MKLERLALWDEKYLFTEQGEPDKGFMGWLKGCFDEERLILSDMVKLGEADSMIEFPPIEYQEVLRELRKIGINLNQLASKAHTLGFVDEREYKAESDRLWRVVAELSSQMSRGGVKFGNNKDMGC